ncbi:flagellar biosynthesis protein FlhA [Oscillospiraceae bacterium OttesenSCG-928-F05]|nr:flagellar biosynthesis protein FlhA [Oscillospiraceae bacterium OttesenSCG-928-F05]
MKNVSNVALALAIVFIVLILIVPLPGTVLDVLLVLNISISVIILLVAVYTKEPLDFSVFPPMLLVTTIFRLGLNVGSTKLILGNNGDAGQVIQTFGSFVIGSNIVVGFIIFIIIVAINFLVITKGSERVAEVAARFTLDAMPGKQMAIDADLNSGLIDEQEARVRRKKIQRESDFFGSMDGASKFVKGDATMGILITLINIIGGIIMGIVFEGGEIMDVVQKYMLVTVGDGLVSQIPALLISTATGIIVTKAGSEENLGTDLVNQMRRQPTAIILAGVVIFIINFIPGMPHGIMIIMAGLFITLGVVLMRAEMVVEVEPEDTQVQEAAEETRRPENVVQLLQVDPIELEFGYAIIPLADVSQGGDLLDRVVMIRRQCAVDLGMIVPVIRLRDNIQFGPNEYVIKIKGNIVASGEIMIDHYLAMNPGYVEEEIDGIETIEPTFGLPAMWVNKQQREKAELLGYTIVDPPSVIATHLTEIVRRHAHELLGRQQVQALIENLKQSQPALVEEVCPAMFSYGEIQKILGNLLREGVSVRDMGTIVETIGDCGAMTRDTDLITEYVRQALRRTITNRFAPERKAHVLTLDPNLEKVILDNVKRTEHGSYVQLEPDTMQKIFLNVKDLIERLAELGIQPIVVTSPVVRIHFKRLIEQMAPDLVVLSYNELDGNVDIQTDGMVSVAS